MKWETLKAQHFGLHISHFQIEILFKNEKYLLKRTILCKERDHIPTNNTVLANNGILYGTQIYKKIMCKAITRCADKTRC